MRPLSTAASAFRMEEPAAPMTAKHNVSGAAEHLRFTKLTVVAQGNKLDVEDAALILTDTADTDGVAL